MSKLFISTDSTADISWCFAKYDIIVVPSAIIVGDKIYKDGVDITPEDIFNSVDKLNIMPTTSAGHEDDYRAAFEKSGGKPHLHIALSPMFSSSYDNAVRAAEDFPNVKVINSGNMSSGLGILSVVAREMADGGKTLDEIVPAIEIFINRVRSSFVLDRLTYLHKGGRCSGLKLFGANLLKLHPIIYVDPYGKMLTSNKLLRGSFPSVVKKYTQYILDMYPDINKDMIFITHTAIDREIEMQVEADLKAAGFKRIFNTVLGSCLSSHCGRNTIGLTLCLDKV